MKWIRLIVAVYAALLLAGLAALAALGVLEPMALRLTVLEVAIALGLALVIALAAGGDNTARRHLGQR
jgi:hypothetical protein